MWKLYALLASVLLLSGCIQPNTCPDCRGIYERAYLDACVDFGYEAVIFHPNRGYECYPPVSKLQKDVCRALVYSEDVRFLEDGTMVCCDGRRSKGEECGLVEAIGVPHPPDRNISFAIWYADEAPEIYREICEVAERWEN